MDTIIQLEAPVKYGSAIEASQELCDQTEIRKLLLVNGLSGDVSPDIFGTLRNLESSVVELTQGCDGLFTKVSVMQPDVLIITVQTLEQKIIDELIKVHHGCPLPVIVVADEYQPKLLENAVCAGVSSYLVDEVSHQRLSVILDLSIARFKQQQSLISELQVTKDKLSERKVIARAKGIIMKQKNLSEQEAYSQMRRSAMDQGQSIAVLSKKIISVFDMLD